MLANFKRFGSRIAAALQLAKPAELAKIATGLNEALAKGRAEAGLDLSGREPQEAASGPVFVRNNIGRRARSVRKGTQSKFHAKRAGGAALGIESHNQAHFKQIQLMNNTLLQKLLWSNGHMDAKHVAFTKEV